MRTSAILGASLFVLVAFAPRASSRAPPACSMAPICVSGVSQATRRRGTTFGWSPPPGPWCSSRSLHSAESLAAASGSGA
jgi:hypothetical protein